MDERKSLFLRPENKKLTVLGCFFNTAAAPHTSLLHCGRDDVTTATSQEQDPARAAEESEQTPLYIHKIITPFI